MKVLGIESSCDDVSVAIVTTNKEVLFHESYTADSYNNGIVPEFVARNHLISLPSILHKCSNYLSEINAVSVTAGPGLIGSLIVGVMMAKTIAGILDKPCIPINHLEGHALTARYCYNDLTFPYILLLVSGGHCQLLIVYRPGQYTLLGTTVDDAPGEVFDKIARCLKLPYPGGPQIEKLSELGDPNKFIFPKAFFKAKHSNFSFSGLKTAVINVIKTSDDYPDIAASFQKTIADILIDRVETTLKYNIKKLVISGGVASNTYIRNAFNLWTKKHDIQLFIPPKNLCTDNGLMIAWAAIERLSINNYTNDLRFIPFSSWNLQENE
jgi:N6-L-threonylcarbamoyladenine synthase